MLFNTPLFFGFLVVTLILFYVIPRRGRTAFLVLTSYVFYAAWSFRFVPLLIGLTLTDYSAGRFLGAIRDKKVRHAIVMASVVINLGFLGVFKYYNFVAVNLAALLGKSAGAFSLSIVLPLGISFHTFQSISYIVDVYRGDQAPIRNVLDYALFISFFPQLVAGPIVRAEVFFRDLFKWRRPQATEVLQGIFLLSLGLTKKMAFADRFAPIANEYFNNISGYPGIRAAWCGVLSFGLQIYFDFSGYNDMAIGMAKLFGFHFPPNFRRPYLASSIADFWHRWHISLSTCLRDYLYIPLGGNRRGILNTYRNLIVTMLLGGLWHGANWSFLVWGGYHGTLLSGERMLKRRCEPFVAWRWLPLISIPLTFVLVQVGWVFFRAHTISQAGVVIGAMFVGGRGPMLAQPWHKALAGLALVLAVLEERFGFIDRVMQTPTLLYSVALGLVLLCLELFGVIGKPVPFVYFQF
jgi:D-alanyl-lipoteichoic acid acyltransferase DltB (MBOAT superfamily)